MDVRKGEEKGKGGEKGGKRRKEKNIYRYGRSE